MTTTNVELPKSCHERPDTPLVLQARELRKTFQRETGEIVKALDDVSVAATQGTLTALVGPDGAGKTTLMRLAAGLMTASGGTLTVLGVDVAADPAQDPSPHRLYAATIRVIRGSHGAGELGSICRFARHHSGRAKGKISAADGDDLAWAIHRSPGRPALGRHETKAGTCFALVRSPELLLLDEPTVGVDPLSRRELWSIILQLVRDQHLTVVVSTSYMDEADRCDHAIVLNQGEVLAEGPPAQVTAEAQGRTFLAETPAGETARELQARILGAPGVVDAVPEGGNVRFVRAAAAGDQNPRKGNELAEVLHGVEVRPVDPRFEDGFMVLLRRASASMWREHCHSIGRARNAAIRR